MISLHLLLESFNALGLYLMLSLHLFLLINHDIDG
jgi:hypothetical protein